MLGLLVLACCFNIQVVIIFIGQFVLITILLATITLVAILALIFISGITSSIYGAPYVPTGRCRIRTLLAWGGLSADDVFCDLGCGDGRMLISAVRDFNVKKAIGYEAAPWPYIKAKLVARLYGVSERVAIIRQNFLKADLFYPVRGRSPQGDSSTAFGGAASNGASASFIYMYLFPKLVDQLATKLAGELRAGTKILSLSFPINLDSHPEFSLIKSEKIGKITAYLYERI